MKKLLIFWFGILSACSDPKQTMVAKTHPLDSWSDEIMYFVMTDRFADGDSSNNHQGQGEYNPHQPHAYHGGDLQGLRKQIPYLKSLGITSLWLTPPVRNAIWSRDSNVTGYHGYWANHFAQVDPHLGDLKDYQQLSQSLHSNGIRLIQDVVTNHVADYFSYQGAYDSTQPWSNFMHYGRPLQAPFHLNDARNPKHLQAAIYHFTPAISNYQDQTQKLTWQMSDLDDLNTTNPRVIEALKKSFRFWIDSVGIDGIRFDTPLYVDHSFWHQFLHDSTQKSLGLKPYANAKGLSHFFTFGETWVNSAPLQDQGELLAKKYLGSAQKPEMDGILHFPMQQSVQRVFAGGASTAELAYRVAKEQAYFPHSWQRLHFIDNHDMPRFRSGANEGATRQALAFTLTIPGIPVIYYGTEHGITETRGNLFGKLDTSSTHFKFLQKLIALRKSSPCFTRGKIEILAADSAGAGIFCYKLSFGEEVKWVVFNTADYPIHSGLIPLGTPKSGEMKRLLQEGQVKSSAIIAGNLNHLELGAKAFVVFDIQSGTGKKAKADIRWSRPNLPDSAFSNSLKLSGLISGVDSLKVFINGNSHLGYKAQLDQGKYEVILSLSNVPEQNNQLIWVAYTNGSTYCLATQRFSSKLPEDLLASQKDPARDDRGPKGMYLYPTAFGELRSMDFKKATVYAQGNKIRLLVDFDQAFSQAWNPPLGFDHLQLNLLLHWNEEQGGADYSAINFKSPIGKKISRVIQINGWQIQTFAVDSLGQLSALSNAPDFRVVGAKTMEITIKPDLLGFPNQIDKLDVVMLSWDSAGEGGLRPLQKQAGPFSFGGGKPTDPLWMDQLRLSWHRP